MCVWCVVCGMWCVVCGVWCVVCGVWCVVCGVWCVVCGVWCVVCGVWCVVCGVWCACGACACASASARVYVGEEHTIYEDNMASSIDNDALIAVNAWQSWYAQLLVSLDERVERVSCISGLGEGVSSRLL